MMKTMMAVAVIAAAGWLGFSAQPRVAVNGDEMLYRIRTDAAHNWPAEIFRGCPNITYHVPDGHTVRDSAEWDTSLRDAAKQWLEAAQRKERPPGAPGKRPPKIAAQRKERPKPPKLTDEQCRQFDLAYFDARKAGQRFGRE